jgi:hypothetical protein
MIQIHRKRQTPSPRILMARESARRNGAVKFDLRKFVANKLLADKIKHLDFVFDYDEDMTE